MSHPSDRSFQDSDDDEVSNVDIDKQIEQIFNSKKSVKETMVGANEQGESKFLCLNVGQTKNKINQKKKSIFE